MKWFGFELLFIGLLMVICLVLVRPLLILPSFAKIESNLKDKSIASIMIPRGLASAVLASVALEKGLEHGQLIQNAAYTVIVLSIIVTALLAFACKKNVVSSSVEFLFQFFSFDRKSNSKEVSAGITDSGTHRSIEPDFARKSASNSKASTPVGVELSRITNENPVRGQPEDAGLN